MIVVDEITMKQNLTFDSHLITDVEVSAIINFLGSPLIFDNIHKSILELMDDDGMTQAEATEKTLAWEGVALSNDIFTLNQIAISENACQHFLETGFSAFLKGVKVV